MAVVLALVGLPLLAASFGHPGQKPAPPATFSAIELLQELPSGAVAPALSAAVRLRKGSAGGVAAEFWVGAAAVKITPAVKADGPKVWLAGFDRNRAATGIHDNLFARAVVVDNGGTSIALVTVDLIGLFLEHVDGIRSEVASRRLPIDHVVIASTHNHEGPDTMGLWGPSVYASGIDLGYLHDVQQRIVDAIRQASNGKRRARLRFAQAQATGLINDSRLPTVIDERIMVMEASDAESGQVIATLVSASSHPAAMGRHNRLVTADFPGYLVGTIEQRRGGLALFFSGAIGGLMGPGAIRMLDPQTGESAQANSFRNTELYGEAIGLRTIHALEKGQLASENAIWMASHAVSVPLENPVYQAGIALGIIGAGEVGERLQPQGDEWVLTTEVGLARVGEALFVLMPGEIYPELLLGGVPDPAEAAVDFPEAPPEPPLLPKMKAAHVFFIGLANDEIGYLIPRRQWDAVPPFAYGRKNAQYGEINSVGPMSGATIHGALQALLEATDGGTRLPTEKTRQLPTQP